MKPIYEDGYEVYKEIQKRGLHIRSEYGRDNSLLMELCSLLHCPDDLLAAFLKKEKVTAEQFIRAFMKVVAPFALMFVEIWEFLASHAAPRATESILVRFGWDTDGINIDLDQFRIESDKLKKMLVKTSFNIWPSDAVHELFNLKKVIDPAWQSAVRSWPDYRFREPYTLLDIEPGTGDRFEEIVCEIHAVFQAMADADAEWSNYEKQRKRGIPELFGGPEDGEYAPKRPVNLGLISDLLPGWKFIFDTHRKIPKETRAKAVEYFDQNIGPLIQRSEIEKAVFVREMLDILDLPFWSYRWHTYEIWATIVVLKALTSLNPVPIITNGHLLLDLTATSKIAQIHAKQHPTACIINQLETPFKRGKRKAIRPDINICYDDHGKADSRAVIVEVKQRMALSKQHVEEVGSAYLDGSPQARGVILINYDQSGVDARLPKNVTLHESVRPDNRTAMEKVKERVLKWTLEAGLIPFYDYAVVLLDVSGSMKGLYDPESVQKALWKLFSLSNVKIYSFNVGLLPGGDYIDKAGMNIETKGGTSLKATLRDLSEQQKLPEVILVISDGEYESYVEELLQVKKRKRILPSQLEMGIEWLMNPMQQEYDDLGSDPVHGD